jgi:hypothetical protein
MPKYITEQKYKVIESRNKDVTVFQIGIQGPPGVSEDQMDYEKRVDYIDDYTLYKGKAAPGTQDSDPAWAIVKVTISPVDDDVVESWADGNANSDKIWDNRTGYTYQN